YNPSESNEFDLELANSLENLFEDLNNESDGREEPLAKKPKKIKKLRSETYCTSCKTDLVSQDSFIQHNIDIHSLENGLYKCFGCERVFKHRKRCLRHETEYCKALKKGYKCGICQKFLQSRGSFEKHLRAHKENKNLDLPEELFNCRKCIKQFISMDLLNEHRMIHEKDKNNWVCDRDKNTMSWKTVTLNSDIYTYEYFLTEYVCRICWCQEITSDTPEDVETDVTIAEKLFECIGVELTIHPRPAKICLSCRNEVENINEFRSFCLTTQRKLYDILQRGPQNQTKPDTNLIEDYNPSESNEFDLELANSLENLFEDLNNESDGREEPLAKKPKKIKKLRSETYCTSCKTDLVSQDSFIQHNIDIHSLENGLYKCFGCERVFKHRKRCLRHETEYCKALKKGYKCGICQKFLQSRGSFEKHLRAHKENKNLDLPEELFNCRKCIKQFISMDLLNEHRTIHEKDKNNWVCDTCGRVFTRRDYLHKHKLIHEGIKQHVCPHCGFRTIQKSSLNVHIR
ncbi:Uncharacterized protein OBRU01_00548, partial [Operophtera brumata]